MNEEVRFHASAKSQLDNLSPIIIGWLEGEPIEDDQVYLNRAIGRAHGVEPLVLLSHLYLIGFAGVRGESGLTSDRAVQQSELELLQAALLRNQLKSFKKGGKLTLAVLSEIMDNVNASLHAFYVNFAKDERHKKKQKGAMNALINDSRIEGLFIRNDACPQHIQLLIEKLFSSVAVEMKNETGMAPLEFYSFVLNLWKEQNRRATKHFNDVNRIRTAGSMSKGWELFKTLFRPNKKEQLRLLQLMNKRRQDACEILCFSTSEWSDQIYTFTEAELHNLLPATANRKNLCGIEKCFVEFGDLSDFDMNHVFLDNPVWTRPFIKLPGGKFFMAGLSSFFSFPVRILLNVLADVPGVIEKFHQEKGKVLEKWLIEVVSKYFHHDEIYYSVKRHVAPHGEEGENDIVIFSDGLLLVIEAKAGEAEDSAFRGGSLGIDGTIGHLITYPAKQSSDFIDFVQSQKTLVTFETAESGKLLSIDPSELKHTISISVTLDLLGLLASNITRLVTAGLMNTPLVPTLSILDFVQICELIETAPELLFYFSKRHEIETHKKLRIDEQDYLALFMNNGFDSGSLQRLGEHEPFGESTTIFDYFYQEWTGAKIEKPCREYSDLWSRLVEGLDSSRPPGWTILSRFLLGMSLDDQRQIGELLVQMEETSLSTGETVALSFKMVELGGAMAILSLLVKGSEKNGRTAGENAVLETAQAINRVFAIEKDVVTHGECSFSIIRFDSEMTVPKK